MGDLDFDLSRSLKMKSDYVIGLPMCAFLLMANSNIGFNLAPLRDMTLWNLSDLDFDLSRPIVMVSFDSPHMVSYSWLIVT